MAINAAVKRSYSEKVIVDAQEHHLAVERLTIGSTVWSCFSIWLDSSKVQLKVFLFH